MTPTNHSASGKLSEPNSAADLIRQKLDSIYTNEPDAKEEIKEIKSMAGHLSKHQQYMYELSNSGRSLAEIQTAWHNYYSELPDAQKHQVWQEFYEEHNRRRSSPSPPQSNTAPIDNSKHQLSNHNSTTPRTVASIKKQISHHVSARTKAKRGGHLKSLLFGLSSGFVVVLFLLFGFFNEKFIAPFISPSKTVGNSSIIIDPSISSVGPEPKIIIPKINVEIPVVFDEPSIQEEAFQEALKRGAVHYATSSNPGELGNGAIFGHSSNNILNDGQYKFAFVLLNLLEPGDTFYVQKDSVRYVYKVFDKEVVKPTQVEVINDTKGKLSSFSLITCDPPGSAVSRLVIKGEQISPDPASNIASISKTSAQEAAMLPSNAESLWRRLTSWISS